MRRAWMAGLLIAACGAVAGGADPSTARAADRSRVLEMELAAAKKPAAYIVLDLEAKTLELRLRGLALKTWPLARVGSRGRTIRTEAVKLLRRTAWSKPKRTNITPGGKKQDDVLDVLEAGDMPARFRMVFEKGISVTVGPKGGNVFRKLGAGLGAILRGAYIPLKTLWFAAWGKDFTEIRITVGTEAEARAIYWALQDGMEAIIFRP